jgi:hypothetical protein
MAFHARAMAGNLDSLAIYRNTLPAPPRQVPPEVETLLAEIVAAVTRRCLGLSVLILALTIVLLPDCWSWALLELRGRPAQARVVKPPRQLIRFPVRRLSEVEVEFKDLSGNHHRTQLQVHPTEARALHPGLEVQITYDPHAPGRIRLAQGRHHAPLQPLGLLVTLSVLLPIAGTWIGRRLVTPRRHAYERGSAATARLEGYSRGGMIPRLRLQVLHDGQSLRVRELVAPAEVDRYPPLADMLVLLHHDERGRPATYTVGLLHPRD